MKTRAGSRPCLGDHVADHLRDRGASPLPAAGVAGAIPVEAQIVIVGAGLLGKQHGEAVAVGELRPAAAAIIHRGILGAAVEDDDQRRAGRKRLGT